MPGRGLLAAVMGLIAVALFAALLPTESETASLAQRTTALRQIILLFSAMTFGAGLLIWLELPKRHSSRQGQQPRFTLSGIARVLTMPSVWLQAAIILCAYTGFKATDDFSLYAYDVVGLNEINAAQAGVVSLWVRPVAAIGAGYLADRFGAVPMTISSFVMLAAGSLVMASGFIGAGMVWIFLLTIVCSSMGIFALRGLYYAIMQDGKVPMAFTGSAVGFVSFIGYTPDVFMGPLMGYLLDASPGAVGQQHVAWVVSGFALAGVVASYLFSRATGLSISRVLSENHIQPARIGMVAMSPERWTARAKAHASGCQNLIVVRAPTTMALSKGLLPDAFGKLAPGCQMYWKSG